jgi:hypothetical protein
MARKVEKRLRRKLREEGWERGGQLWEIKKMEEERRPVDGVSGIRREKRIK